MFVVHKRPQVMYSLDIGSNDVSFCRSHPAITNVANCISELVGGCTLIDGSGYWADVERADKDSYEDYAIGVERNVQLQVKGEVEKEEELEETIVSAIVAAALLYPNLGINWVCGHKVQRDGSTIAFNFSVNEINDGFSK